MALSPGYFATSVSSGSSVSFTQGRPMWMHYIERRTNMRIINSYQDHASLRVFVTFDNGKRGYVLPHENYQLVFLDDVPCAPDYCEPNGPCASCGERDHASSFDALGRYSNTVRKFWKKVRKVYWHRYSRQKALKLPYEPRLFAPIK